MPSQTRLTMWRRAGAVAVLLAAAVGLAAPAQAQYLPKRTAGAIGEQYHFEIGGTFWTPEPIGVVSSTQLNLVGSEINLADDLGYKSTKFRELKIVVRPGKKHRLRFNWTPIEYTASTTLTRTISFAGRTFTVSLPIESTFTWKVRRIGYEWDFLYKSRGFIGVMVEGQWTEAKASLVSPAVSGEVGGHAVLPAIWFVGRAYPARNLALNLEVGGMNIPEIEQRYQGHYLDWDVSATFNFGNNFGVQGGWRRMTNFLTIDNYSGDLKFQGWWYGLATRF